MKKLFAISALLLITVTLFFAGCSKDEDPGLPIITFNQALGYTSGNSTVHYGDTINMGIIASYNGSNNLVKFQLFCNGISKVDTTFNTKIFIYNYTTIKDMNNKDVWKFVTTDIAGNVKTDSIIITRYLDIDPILPTIAFNKAAGYTSSNATAHLGDTIFMGVIATYNGTKNLVKFQLYTNSLLVLDSTINTTYFTFNFSTIKGVNDKDVWKFVTTDIAGNVKSDSIIITGSFGEINSYANVKFGAQSNTTVEGFASYSNAQVTMYFQAAAFEHQSDIDMFCFYENNPPSYVNLMTLAAPGSNISGIFTGATAPNLYTTKNITFFVKTTLTVAEFDAVHNDAVILDSYNPASQFKKAKLLTVNDIYAFKLQSGKYGLLKVTAVDGNETGTLQIAVKIQK